MTSCWMAIAWFGDRIPLITPGIVEILCPSWHWRDMDVIGEGVFVSVLGFSSRRLGSSKEQQQLLMMNGRDKRSDICLWC